MTVFLAICALFLSALSVLFAAAAGMVGDKPNRGGLILVALGGIALSGASVLWVAVGLRMAGV